MPTTDSELRREAIRRTLARRAGGTPDASSVAKATLGIWHQVSARLAPVIGARGVDALFSRSLQLTSAAFPWLAIIGENMESADLLANIETRLAWREPETALEVSYTLLVTFTELMATLIGESLTGRLLDPVWVPPSPASEKEAGS